MSCPWKKNDVSLYCPSSLESSLKIKLFTKNFTYLKIRYHIAYYPWQGYRIHTSCVLYTNIQTYPSFFADLGGVHPVLPCWWREGFEPWTGEAPSLVVFSQIHLFSFSHFHLSRVQVEEYKKKYGPNGEFINNIWCQCWWSDETHTCLPHLVPLTG